jgi:hypothetical protein
MQATSSALLTSRQLKNAHLRRYPHPSSLRRTGMYVSFLGISGALHLAVFEQPVEQVFFSNLLGSSSQSPSFSNGDLLCHLQRKVLQGKIKGLSLEKGARTEEA